MSAKEEKPTVKIITDNDLCIGCGLCKISCTFDAIVIKFDKNKEYKPIIDFDKCTYCSLCYVNCPMAEQNLNKRIANASIKNSEYGLSQAINFYKGYENDYQKYIKSSSGGILSALLKYLLKTNKIDAVVHAEQNVADSSGKYFQASISKSVEEIDSKRSSFYYPIEFSEVLEKIIADDSIKNVAFLGTPCVISSMKYLTRTRKDLRAKIKYKFSLMCSHNTSAQFTDMLVSAMTKDNSPKTFKHRDKENITKDDNFNNTIDFENGKKLAVSRYKTPFTTQWRSFSYAMNGCNFCPDFYGVDADAGFKDAWGFSVEQKEGETVLFSNNQEISELLAQMQEEQILTLSEITKKELSKSQKTTISDKTIYTQYRQKRNKYLRKTAKQKVSFSLLENLFLFLNFRFKKLNIRFSKFLYRNFKKRTANFFMKLPGLIIWKSSVYLSLLASAREKNSGFEVIYTAGFGYENIGDEAQLSANLSIWEKISDDVTVTLLSPNPEYTRHIHGNYDVLYASRNTFWGYKNLDYSGIGESKYFPIFFRIRLAGLMLSAFFIKYFNKSFLTSPEQSYLLKRIKNANVLHIGGGGYLTGKTPSRLFDYMGLIKIANFLNTDVILSGHNIGIWQNRTQKRIAKQLKKAKYIGLRDNDKSIESLKEISVYDSSKVIPLYDDALFCESATREELEKYFVKNSLNINKKYILINSYYFKSTEKIVKQTLEKITNIVDVNFKETDIEIILLSMHESDLPALKFVQKNLNLKSSIFYHNDDFRIVISLIRNAHIVISMRHHPIIFAMSNGVPTISVVFDDYFKHKNNGAMKLFEQENYVCREDEVENGVFEKKLKTLIEKRDDISSIILKNTNNYRIYKGLIIESYLKKYTSLTLNKIK